MRVAAFIISAIGVFWSPLATLFIGPNFVKLFDDFGGQLPALTRIFMGPWAPLALAIAAFFVVAATTRVSAKWVPLTVAIVTTLVQPAIFLIAMYLPIFAIADRLQST